MTVWLLIVWTYFLGGRVAMENSSWPSQAACSEAVPLAVMYDYNAAHSTSMMNMDCLPVFVPEKPQ